MVMRDVSPKPVVPRARGRRGGSCFFWFLTGGLLGALGVAVAWMMDEHGDASGQATVDTPHTVQTPPKLQYQYPKILPNLRVDVPAEDRPKSPPALPPPPSPPEAAKESTKAGAKEATKSRPQEATKSKPQEATTAAVKPPVKESVKEPAKPVKEPAKPAEATDGGDEGASYILQIASLASSAEADRFKARLDAQGFASSIQTVTINGKTYYRVRTGPYKGKEATAKAKSDLTSKGHQAIMVKVK